MATKQNPLTAEELGRKISGMKKGDSFTVKTPSERVAALLCARSLKGAKAIEFRIRTVRNDDGTFIVLAV